jgi:hypothetical protein
MQNLRTLKVSELADLLNKQMTIYYGLIADRSFKKELSDCKIRIKEIQKEIETRKKKIFK